MSTDFRGTVELVLKDHPIGYKNVVSRQVVFQLHCKEGDQDRWSLRAVVFLL